LRKINLRLGVHDLATASIGGFTNLPERECSMPQGLVWSAHWNRPIRRLLAVSRPADGVCFRPEADRRPVSSKAEEAQSGSISGAPPVNPCPTKQRKHKEGVRIEGQWIGQRRERCTTEDLQCDYCEQH